MWRPGDLTRVRRVGQLFWRAGRPAGYNGRVMSPRAAAGGRLSTPPPAESPAEGGLRALPALLHAAEGWAGLRAALAGRRSGTIDGAWGSSAALAVAALAADAP